MGKKKFVRPRGDHFTKPERRWSRGSDAVPIARQSRSGMVTLLYGAKDLQINHAAVLLAYLVEKENAE